MFLSQNILSSPIIAGKSAMLASTLACHCYPWSCAYLVPYPYAQSWTWPYAYLSSNPKTCAHSRLIFASVHGPGLAYKLSLTHGPALPHSCSQSWTWSCAHLLFKRCS
eukprot:scaffold50955_cov19-Tisochrysis_lutea.AAC.2